MVRGMYVLEARLSALTSFLLKARRRCLARCRTLVPSRLLVAATCQVTLQASCDVRPRCPAAPIHQRLQVGRVGHFAVFVGHLAGIIQGVA